MFAVQTKERKAEKADGIKNIWAKRRLTWGFAARALPAGCIRNMLILQFCSIDCLFRSLLQLILEFQDGSAGGVCSFVSVNTP